MSALDEDSGTAGFTLIEVMVVVLIIGILLGIGVPTFLGARERAQDRAAQANLGIARAEISELALVDVEETHQYFEAIRSSSETFEWAWYKELSTGPDQISFTLYESTRSWAAAALSDSGTCFVVWKDSTEPMQYGTTTPDLCSAINARQLAVNPSW